MSTWKGKTRGGTFGYLFFIYLIKYLGITAAYLFLSLVVLYFIPFAPKATKSTNLEISQMKKQGWAKVLLDKVKASAANQAAQMIESLTSNTI